MRAGGVSETLPKCFQMAACSGAPCEGPRTLQGHSGAAHGGPLLHNMVQDGNPYGLGGVRPPDPQREQATLGFLCERCHKQEALSKHLDSARPHAN